MTTNQKPKSAKKKKKKKEELPKLNFGVLKRIYRLFIPEYRQEWKLLTLGYSAIAVVIFLGLLVPLPLKFIIDYVVLSNPLPESPSFLAPLATLQPTDLLLVFTVAFIVIHFLDMFISYAYRIGLSIAGSRMIASFRERLFAHLTRLSLSFHQSSASGDIVFRMTTDVNELNAILVDAPQQFLRRIFAIVFYTSAMLYINVNLALLSFIIIPMIIWFNRRFSKKVKKATKKKKKKQSEVSSIIADNVTAMALVQAYGREDAQHSRFTSKNQKSKGYQLEAIKLSKIFKRVNALLVAFGTTVVVYYGGTLVINEILLPGTLVLCASYLKKLYGPIDKISDLIFSIAKAQVAGERLLEIMESDMVMEDSSDAIEPPPFQGGVEFKNVHFAYGNGSDVLRDLTFKVHPGETVAILGPSGAGKSTLVSLLMRFFDPQKGQVLFDDQDIRKFKIRSMREQVTILLQDAKLLNRSVYDNIAFGKDNATEEEVVNAAQLACAHEFVTDMADGYETTISEGGENLSGGQKQRLNFARAIIRSTPIVILDEPTTALDASTEAELNRAFHEISKNRTTFVIAHKFSTIANADKVIFLQEGKEAVIGSHEHLVTSSEGYRELYRTQTRQRVESQVKYDRSESHQGGNAEGNPGIG